MKRYRNKFSNYWFRLFFKDPIVHGKDIYGDQFMVDLREGVPDECREVSILRPPDPKTKHDRIVMDKLIRTLGSLEDSGIVVRVLD